MTTMFYYYESHMVADVIEDWLNFVNLKLNGTDCLCKTPITSDISSALIHPHRGNYQNCYGKIEEQIINHPEIKFYIFALGNSSESVNRRKLIGTHPNLEYIIQPETGDLERIANEMKEAELKKLIQ